MPLQCLNYPDTFYYVCGELALNFKVKLYFINKKLLSTLFCLKSRSPEQQMSPIFLVTCSNLLTEWTNGSYNVLFAVPIMWRRLKDYCSNSYFLLSNATEITIRTKQTLIHLNKPSAIGPVLIVIISRYQINRYNCKSNF